MTDSDTHIMDIASSTPVSVDDDRGSSGWNRTTLTEDVIAALRTVQDPEIPVNVYDLGLIYRIEPKDQALVEIDMTLTAPGCPVANEMVSWVRKAVSAVDGVADVKVSLVFDPPWDRSKISEEVQLELGLV